jgi:hypothetical protein
MLLEKYEEANDGFLICFKLVKSFYGENHIEYSKLLD